MKKLILLLMPFIALTACGNNSKKVDLNTFKEEVKKIDVSNLKELNTIKLNGYIKSNETDYKWNNKELSTDNMSNWTIGDLSILILIPTLRLDSMVNGLTEENFEFYIGNEFKMLSTDPASKASMSWNKELFVTYIFGNNNGSDCNLTLNYTYKN